MQKKIARIAICGLFLMVSFFSKPAVTDYIEGIDTTDANGYGLDSTFQIKDNTIYGQNLACYFCSVYCGAGAFDYSFNDIKLGPDSIFFVSRCEPCSYIQFSNSSYCFALKKNKDSTYSKVQILQKLADNQYVFKYGTNTTPNTRIFEKFNYDRSLRYKPNNLFYCYWCQGYDINSFTWEPPLPNNNHLIGYILYIQKAGVFIDTTAPINIAQWDSVSFTDSTKTSFFFHPHGQYFNMVAVYTEGKSDFLNGWTQLTILSGNKVTLPNRPYPNAISVQKTSSGFLFDFHHPVAGMAFNIFSITGRHIARLSGLNGNRVFWNARQRRLVDGLYIFRAELPDRTVLIQPFMVTQ